MCVCVSVDIERYNCLMPVMNTMLEKCEHMLNISAYLPNIPHSDANPAFSDDFRNYLQSNEWKTFMKKQASYTHCLFSDGQFVVYVDGRWMDWLTTYLVPYVSLLLSM